MELLVIVAVAVAAIAWFIWKHREAEESRTHPLDGATKAPEPWPFPTSRPPEGDTKEQLPVMPTLTATLDVNKDGKVDFKDAVEAVKEVKAKVTKVADLNKDGKVDKADAKLVVEATKKTGRKIKAKAVETAEKTKKAVKKKTK